MLVDKYEAKLEHGLFFIQATGFSMRPFVRGGDRLIIRKTNVQDLKIGDIILYKLGNNSPHICHRLVKKINSNQGIKLFARGDSFNFLDDPILEENIQGCIIGILRNGRVINLRNKFQSILNWLIAQFYVFLRPLLVYLWKLFKSLRAIFRKLWKKKLVQK